MAFPTVTLLDSFKRSENPLSNGGKWKTFFPINNGTGFCNGTSWENKSASKVEGAYWSPTEFTNPGVAIDRSLSINDSGYWTLWACLSNPTTSKISGYRLKMLHTGAGLFEVKLERCDENSFTVLSTSIAQAFAEGDRIGLSVQSGKVEYYRKKGVEEWEERASKADTTYTTGFVGFAVEAQDGDTTNFEAGSGGGGGSGPSVENPGKQRTHTFKSVSLQIHALNVTKYFATNLPTGLSIDESTGLITGEAEAEESPVVKIQVENETAETAETSFEWIITTGSTNVVGMIVS